MIAAVAGLLAQAEKNPVAYALGASLPFIFTLAGIVKSRRSRGVRRRTRAARWG